MADKAELPGVNKDGSVPARRIKDAKQAHAIYTKFDEDDRQSAIERTKVRAMFNGERPYDEQQLARSGQSYRCNVNFGLGDSMKEEALSSYVDLINSEETLIRCETTFGEPGQRQEWADAISREYTKMIRGWDSHYKRFMQTADEFVGHGVAVVYWPDDIDWRWDSTGLGNFLLPRSIEAEESAIELAFLEKTMTPADLYNEIKDGKSGWNKEAVKQALVKNVTSSRHRGPNYRWEDFENEVKNNDLGISYTNEVIRIVHCWVKEFDGTVSHGIFCQDNPDKEWLYYEAGKFEKMTNAFVVYTYGIGNGHYHGIRGLGYKIFHHAQVDNRMLCSAVDGQNLRNSFVIQPRTEEDLDKLAHMVNYGYVTVMPPGYDAVNPHLTSANDALGMVHQIRGMAKSKTDGYNPANALPETGPERSRFEIAARLEQGAQLSDSAKGQWYEPETRRHRETFRRIQRKNYPKNLPGGEAVQKMRQNLVEQGVPLEALFAVDLDTVRVVRAVGSGSPAARGLSIRNVMDLSPGLPEAGRKRAIRMALAHNLGGYDEADAFMPATEPVTNVAQRKQAMLENNDLIGGEWVEVLEGEFHLTHADVHLDALQQFEAQIEEGVPPMEFAQQMQMLQAHGVEHVERIADDPTSEADAARLRQAYQQFSESINNGIKQLEAATQQREQEGGEEIDREELRKDIAFQEEMRRKQIALDQKLEERMILAEAKRMEILQMARAKSQAEDAKAAADIRRAL